MKIIDVSFDERSQCCSVLTKMTLEEYKKIAHECFEKGGNIHGQRDVIRKSTVASKIRGRMHEDFNKHAVFPPVVVGALLGGDIKAEDIKCETSEKIIEILQSLGPENISIIDGMQRSNIYFSNFETNKTAEIRVEFWVANESVKLLYRMLVLNTGQVPWNTRRQVEVVFENLARNISESIIRKYPELKEKIRILSVDDNARRTQPGIIHKSNMIELYLGFNTRNVKVEVNDALADEFQKFDMLESIENDINFDLFVDTIAYLFKLDYAFDSNKESCDTGKFVSGKDIFSSLPACIGFVVACAEYVLGRAPVNREDEIKKQKIDCLKKQLDQLITIIPTKENYLQLTALNEIIATLSTSKIGDEMRRLFRNAFSDLIKYEDLEELPSLEGFWRC